MGYSFLRVLCGFQRVISVRNKGGRWHKELHSLFFKHFFPGDVILIFRKEKTSGAGKLAQPQRSARGSLALSMTAYLGVVRFCAAETLLKQPRAVG